MKDPPSFGSSVFHSDFTMRPTSSGAGARGRGSTDQVGGLLIT